MKYKIEHIRDLLDLVTPDASKTQIAQYEYAIECLEYHIEHSMVVMGRPNAFFSLDPITIAYDYSIDGSHPTEGVQIKNIRIFGNKSYVQPSNVELFIVRNILGERPLCDNEKVLFKDQNVLLENHGTTQQLAMKGYHFLYAIGESQQRDQLRFAMGRIEEVQQRFTRSIEELAKKYTW